MDKAIWKSIGEWFYFLSNVLVGVRVVFLLDCPLVLSLLKHRSVGVFLNKKMRIPNGGSPLNSSILQDQWISFLDWIKDCKILLFECTSKSFRTKSILILSQGFWGTVSGVYTYEAQVGFRIWVRVRVWVCNSAIFEKVGCGCGIKKLLKIFLFIFFIYC